MVNYDSDQRGKLVQYLNDESNIVRNGHADRLYMPINESEVSQILKDANATGVPVTISGAGTGISGGRVPLTGWILATDQMKSISKSNAELWTEPETKDEFSIKFNEIDETHATMTIPVSMRLKSLQILVREKRWFYPPDPTEGTSFLGGNVSTNASGARSFKFSATRKWIQGLRVVLANGTILDLDRDKQQGYVDADYVVIQTDNYSNKVPRPKYSLPKVTKHVAGPVITDSSHPLDLFIGTNGIFGVVTEITVKLIRPPTSIYSMFVYLASVEDSFKLVRFCQSQRATSIFPVPMSVEFMDEKSILLLRSKDDRINPNAKAIIMIEQDVYSDDELERSMEFWAEQLDKYSVIDTDVAQTHAEIEHHKFLRHYLAEYIIGQSRSYNQSLIVSDYSVPEEKYPEFFHFLIKIGVQFENEIANETTISQDSPGYTLFGHAGDCHPHLTLLPRTHAQSVYANQLVTAVLNKTIELGGSIASEHGLGKKKFGSKPALFFQYGEIGLQAVRQMKERIDPNMILCPGNLIPSN
ncbi:MAG: FAD-binding oxidoreductase [Candidatus Heimdallarchaeota archaeon]|nr:FAD-binding oxidoreductase [Candidatus Heimdallarchaeota archaeon]